MIFLGVDVGGSKTHALLCDENGQVLGFGTGPGGNPEMVGYDGLALTGAKDLEDLIVGIVAGRYQLKAGQAPLVVAAAEQGDEVAKEVVCWNAEELAKSVLAVARQLELCDQYLEVVMSGVLFQVSELYRLTFIEQVSLGAPLADCRV